ncbi:MAG: DUF1616 domain-containing protein [Dehalococcoidia bacterium]
MILSFILILIILFIPIDAIRIILGLPFMLFFPGYTLIAALFPGKSGLQGIERLALSVGLSLAVIPLIGLILNCTPWGIRLLPILISLIAFIIAMCIIAFLRRNHLSDDDKYDFGSMLTIRKAGAKESTTLPSVNKKRWMDRLLNIILALAAVVCICTIVYAIVKPKAGEKFSEFYILGTEGKAENYTRDVKLGSPISLTMGIVNHEQAETVYTGKVTIDGVDNRALPTITLAPEQKQEQVISFDPTKVGQNQKVEFLLFRNAETEPYLTLHIWVNVSQ